MRFEIQIETAQSILAHDGTSLVAQLVHESDGRCTGLHFGTYDYTAALGISAGQQAMDHPAAEHAKNVMALAAAGTGVRLSDGSSNVLPVGDPHLVHHIWAEHARLVRRSLERGFYQGWDLHPAQLPTRFAATYLFFRDDIYFVVARLQGYLGLLGQGDDPGQYLDEPATAQALAQFVLRGVDCGALSAELVGDSSVMDAVRKLASAADWMIAKTPAWPADRVFRGRCVLPDGERHAAVGVRDGVIAWVEPSGGDTRREVVSRARDESAVIDLANDEVLLPGLVDTHVHVNEPGRTDWEGFASATRAAAAGGVTTIIDMPLNSIPPTIDMEALATKRTVTEGQRFVDVGFWGGAVPSSLGTLETLYQQGVFGFKCFLLPSGVEEFPPLDRSGLDAAMREVAGFDGLLIVHAEDAATIEGAPAFAGRSYADFLRSRPPEAEDRAIAEVLELAAQHGTRVHVLHLSGAASLSRLAQARDAGVRVTVETCPHYLTLSAEGIEDGATEFKCCPPIRDAANQDGCGRGCGTVLSTASSPTTHRRRLPSKSSRLATSVLPGVAFPLCSLGFRWSGPKRHTGGWRLQTSCGGCLPHPRKWLVLRARARSRRGTTLTSSCSVQTRPSRSIPTGCTTNTTSLPTRGVSCGESYAKPGLLVERLHDEARWRTRRSVGCSLVEDLHMSDSPAPPAFAVVPGSGVAPARRQRRRR